MEEINICLYTSKPSAIHSIPCSSTSEFPKQVGTKVPEFSTGINICYSGEIVRLAQLQDKESCFRQPKDFVHTFQFSIKALMNCVSTLIAIH